MVKCLWCGQTSARQGKQCTACGRELRWSVLFRLVHGPSDNAFKGSRPRIAAANAEAAKLSVTWR